MSEKPRTIEVGFLCENCLEPLPDSPPLAEDWRVRVGRTKRLCPTCAEKEDRADQRKCEFWCAGRPGHSGACFEMYSHRDTCPGKPDCVHDEDESDEEVQKRANQRTKDLLEIAEVSRDLENIGERIVDKLGRCSDAMNNVQTAFERMFRAEGIGPRTAMKRFRDER